MDQQPVDDSNYNINQSDDGESIAGKSEKTQPKGTLVMVDGHNNKTHKISTNNRQDEGVTVIEVQPSSTTNNQQNVFSKFLTNYSRGTGTTDRDKANRQRMRKKYNWKPNCNSNDGGPPYFTVLLILICTAFYFKYNFNKSTNIHLKNSSLIFQPAKALGIDGGDVFELHRYFSYNFLHANFQHILSNMLVLVIVGPILELGHDSFRPLTIYVFGVISGSMFAGLMSRCSTP